jgi:hypothetical protein
MLRQRSDGLAGRRAADVAAVERRRLSKRATKRRKRERAATHPRPLGCEICGQTPKERALASDHDHATGAFRGWLCSPCNLGLGSFRDSPLALRAAAEYIELAGAVPAKEPK